MSSTTRPSLRLRTALARLAVSLLIAAGFVWAMRRGGLPIVPASEALGAVAWWGPAFYVLACCVAIFLRTYRWLYLLRPIAPDLEPGRVFGIGLVGFTAIFFAPLRMGEIARPWLLAEDGEVTFLQAAGTIAAERIIDGLTLTLFFVGSLVLSTPLPTLPDHVGDFPLPITAVSTTAYASCAVFASALLVMALFYRFRESARRLSHAVFGVVSPRLADFVTARLEKLSDGFRFLPSWKHAGAFMRDTVLYWCVMLTATWVLLRGCGLRASFAEAGVIIGVMGLGMLVPSGPGLFGTFQIAAYCGLAMFFGEGEVLSAGAAFAFLSYSITLLSTALSCPLGLMLMRRKASG